MHSSRSRAVLAAVLALVGIFFLTFFLVRASHRDDPAARAAAITRTLSRQLPRLESFVGRPDASLPDRMIVYQYRNGHLEHWRNQFPVHDDASIPYYTGEDYKLQFFSGQPYLVRRLDTASGETFVLGYWLKLDCQVSPAGFFGGHPVTYDGRVLFKAYFTDVDRKASSDWIFLWVAYLLLVAAVLVFLSAKDSTGRAMLCAAVISALFVAMLLALRPSPGFYPSGIIPLLNVFIFSLIRCLYPARGSIAAHLPFLNHKAKQAIGLVTVAGLLVYVHLSLKDLILNGNLEMAFINMSEISLMSFMIALTYLLAMTVIVRLVGSVFRKMTVWEQVAFSLILSVYLVLVVSAFSFRKEEDNLKISTAALALNRDMNLESLLIESERRIQNDTVLVRAAFGAMDISVADYVSETYLSDVSSRYYVSAYLANPGEVRFLSDLHGNLVRISPNSRFYQVQQMPGTRYVAIFPFYQGARVRNIVMILDSGAQPSSTRQTDLHPKYSYARYHGGTLKSFRGSFAYPTVTYEGLSKNAEYRHFVFDFGNSDQIVVSRKRVTPGRYVSAVILCALLYLVLLLLTDSGQGLSLTRKRGYFERNILRISEELVVITVLVIFSVSIFFIYDNNKGVMDTLVAEKISTLQSAVQDNMEHIRIAPELTYQNFTQRLDFISKCTESSLSVYSTDGQLLSSTRQPLTRDVPSYRLPEKVQNQIIDEHIRFFVLKNLRAPVTRYDMYAPLFNVNGDVVGILRSPYFGVETWELENDAVMNVISLISFLVMLLFLARYISERFYTRMIGPLNVMSAKMLSADLDNVEHVEYARRDEIRTIIDSYNMMVDRLEQSTRQLAEAERNQAWTGMARQVAHEIKNPLTPMKLQIQRVMRLKAKGDPQWPEKMEEAAGVMLEHIDVLTKTADDFSSFAKLFSEESVDIDLDALLRQELSMYDCRDDIHFTLASAGSAIVRGPRPQLTRVFVNLLTNAVQAVDTLPEGSARQIFVSLAPSPDARFHLISFQDNGPGIADRNLDRLFTPNFTTKSGGSGLGLAISKSILDKCGATISYSRSETLGGACFTISYPIGRAMPSDPADGSGATLSPGGALDV